VHFSGSGALVFVFEMIKLQNPFVSDGEKEIVKILDAARCTVFQIDKLGEVWLGIDGVHDLERLEQALVVLVYFHYRAAFYVVAVVAFFLVVNIKIEKIGDVPDVSLQGTDGIARDVGILELEGVEEIGFYLGIGCG